jgi:N-acyl-D-aspartate/D-glutamate deacylase
VNCSAPAIRTTAPPQWVRVQRGLLHLDRRERNAQLPTFILTHWGRDRTKGEQLPLEYLVRKLSFDTAAAYGMHDRGLLASGKLADVNVIDFERLSLHRPEAVFDLPAGGKRLVQQVDGYRHIIKRGTPIFEGGVHTGALPGKLVRG